MMFSLMFFKHQHYLQDVEMKFFLSFKNIMEFLFQHKNKKKTSKNAINKDKKKLMYPVITSDKKKTKIHKKKYDYK